MAAGATGVATMEQHNQPFDDQFPPATGATERREVQNQWARLTRRGELDCLTVSGPSGWSVLTTIVATVGEPSMEVLLALESSAHGTEPHLDDVDMATLPLRYAVCIDGPIEELDAEVIEQAIGSGTNLLDADLRVQSAVIVRPADIEILSAGRGPLLAVLAGMLQGAVAAPLKCDPESLPLPDAELIDRLITCTGQLVIRSIETEVYEGFVDLGIVLPDSDDLGPATTSVVFDRMSRSWHTE